MIIKIQSKLVSPECTEHGHECCSVNILAQQVLKRQIHSEVAKLVVEVRHITRFLDPGAKGSLLHWRSKMLSQTYVRPFLRIAITEMLRTYSMVGLELLFSWNTFSTFLMVWESGDRIAVVPSHEYSHIQDEHLQASCTYGSTKHLVLSIRSSYFQFIVASA